MGLLKRSLLLTLCLAAPALAEQVALDSFGYLNNNEAPAIIDQTEAQSLLNVDITAGGKSVKKRKGYGLYKSVGGSSAIHGGHHFYDASGNDVQLWGSNTSLYASVSDASFTTLVTSATTGTTWDCADTQGFAYCVDANRDALIRTDGTAKTWYTSPLGTMVAITPDRLAIAGVAAAPNSIYFSQSGAFTNFTTGNSATDPFIEVIGAPGGRLTHIEYACGRVLWWKDQSFGYIMGSDQTEVQIVTVSNTIGTFDNASAIDPFGNVYFRGQEGHIYRYDCSGIEKLSTPISPTVQTSARRISNQWIQTTQSDFEAGVSSPTGNLSFAMSPNNITLSSFTASDTYQSDFTQGGNSNTTATLSSGAVQLVTGASQEQYEGSTRIHSLNDVGQSFVISGGNGILSSATVTMCKAGTPPANLTMSINSDSSNAPGSTLCSASVASSNFPTCNAGGTNGSAYTFACKANLSASTRYWIKAVCGTCTESPDNSYRWNVTFSDRYANGYSWTTQNATLTDRDYAFVVQFNSTGTYTSRVFDTGLTRSFGGISTYTVTTANGGSVAFSVQTATSTTGAWRTVSSTWTTNAIDRYVRYLSTFTAGSTNTSPLLNDVTLVAASTGSYYSAVKNAASLSYWDTFSASRQENGGTINFFLRSSSNSFTVQSATPSWTSQSAGTVVTIATGTYFQVRTDFEVTAATQTPSLSDFSVYWYEGTAADKAYAVYFDDAIWWSVASGSGQSTNNYILRWDLLNKGWGLYNFGANGMLIQNNNLYFGSPSTNSVYRFGNATSDNGTAITAYWQSKDFTGPDPWLENELTQLDVFARRDPNQTLTVGYTLNASTTTTSYTVSLSSSTESTIRHRKLLPAGKFGGLFSVKFSDSSANSSWEVLGVRIKFNPQTYRPTQ